VKPVYVHLFPTPLGNAIAALNSDGALFHFAFTDAPTVEEATHGIASADETIVADACRFGDLVAQVGEYFRGERRAFSLPLAPRGTAFQHRVWDLLRTVPYGEKATYGELAIRLGNPNAARAVGRANATNPIALVVPCHRVVGADGTLTGYAFGVSRKERLLALEGAAPYGGGTTPMVSKTLA
jgi:methylated-DNA-[protein]-cysteine S-methyltransferase